jgi:hypothetical protein
MKKRTHHAANVRTSSRLKKYLSALNTMCEFTSIQLQRLTNSVSVSSDIDELRKNGVEVLPARYIGRNKNGRHIYGYKLASKFLLKK